ncbi:ribosome biogenesis GTPase YlqF [Aliikangiella marina]|uniref:Ribosome biogenesis GTPase A n=1 Tax=Aliikangiella marina TaxID=1712262 RepID=A0A545TA32_9GAMM|nr:ribosome biogenesis GTPase YlqF [Aliikangiella marina]TQV74071.1 ribosome biogenesis GTPase YlqF [Aliikangiella marina]
MTIQWYPGHMHKAQKEIKQALPGIDVIIEVVDARIPFSSANPVIAELSSHKGLNTPIIKVINKIDLADDKTTALWCEYLDSQQGVKSLPVTSNQPELVKKIIPLCHKMVPQRREKGESVRAMIMGIPNVGKSTIINILSGRTIAKVGNEPAVTQRQQRIDLAEKVTLHDTPGILWPKIENRHSSYRLAITGAIKDTALAYDDIAFYAVDYFAAYYPDRLNEHFKLDFNPSDTLQLLEEIGRKRGCLKAGGRVDLDRVCKILIHEYRSGSIGKISLETPEMITNELVVVEQEKREKEAKKAARKKAFKKKKR